MENKKVEYSEMWIHAVKELEETINALRSNQFEKAYDHCLNAQIEIRLLSGAITTWIPKEEK